MFESMKAKAGNAWRGTKAFGSRYPVTTIFAAATLGVIAVTMAVTPGGLPTAAKAGAKAGAILLGGLALSSLITKTEVQFADEINGLLSAAGDKISEGMAKAREVMHRPDIKPMDGQASAAG